MHRVGANLVFALLGAASRWAITRIAPTQCTNLLWFDLVEATCTRIKAKFPEAAFAVCPHPTQRGAIIDAYVPTDDDFAVLDLVNPELDELLIAEDIAIYVRAIGPLTGVSGGMCSYTR